MFVMSAFHPSFVQNLHKPFNRSVEFRVQYSVSLPWGGGGGGTRLSCGRGGGGAAGGRKPDPVAMRSVHKKYTLSQYTLLKKIHMHTLSQYCTVAGAQIAGLS